jgi:xanthine dehydrogenase accessory factor
MKEEYAMREIIEQVKKWQEQGQRVALATVVKVYGSAPRGLGAKMAINEYGEFSGSVSAGCVEGAVIEEAMQVLKGGPARLLEYGISDDLAFSVGLTCGGIIHVFVEPLIQQPREDAPGFEPIFTGIGLEDLFGRVVILNGEKAGSSALIWPDGRSVGRLPFESENEKLLSMAREWIGAQKTGRVELDLKAEKQDVWIEAFAPRPQLIIVGGVHIAIPLVNFANQLGFHTVVVDARRAFANRERFPTADELVIGWPSDALESMRIHANTFIAVLSHDDKLDLPALKTAIASPARYVGALGSRKTQLRRKEELLEMGATQEQLERIHGPIGLDLGAANPEEIALAIMAQVVAITHGK